MADNDMLKVRSDRDADEAPLAAAFLRFWLAITGTSGSPGFPRWRTGRRNVHLDFNHPVFHGNSQKEACILTFDHQRVRVK